MNLAYSTNPFVTCAPRIGFDELGKVLAWDHVIVGQSITTGTVFGEFQEKDGIDATATEGTIT